MDFRSPRHGAHQLLVAAALVAQLGLHATGAQMSGCFQQKKCLAWTINQVSAPACPGPFLGCQFKVCMTVDNSRLECDHDDDEVDLTCEKSDSTCAASPVLGFQGSTKATKVKVGTMQCQVGAGGSTLEFLLSDGGTCADNMFEVKDLGQSATAECKPRTDMIGSCDAASESGTECVWTISLPSCGEGSMFQKLAVPASAYLPPTTTPAPAPVQVGIPTAKPLPPGSKVVFGKTCKCVCGWETASTCNGGGDGSCCFKTCCDDLKGITHFVPIAAATAAPTAEAAAAAATAPDPA
mmetsp:Transcript_11040/g.27690  ORF Transcript_11040/g.27690 Transcript_11040/m.27690 type:complete len:295 (+) Transcript_11040:57-941(+)